MLALALIFRMTTVQAKGLVKDFNVNGVLSLNWRLIGPKEQGFENQIQHEVYLADMYFDFDGKISGKFPFLLEFQIPTALQGQVTLYRFSANVINKEKLKLEIGKILVPFGHYNELYRPDEFLTVTRPLLYASPDSLDLVIRLNSPRPPLSSGYTDIGTRISYYPNSKPWLPAELTAYVVNGLGENNNRLRTFQNTDKLLVKGIPITGTNIDFGHQNNNLADNNNNKAPGGRIAFAFGDLKIPFPISEGIELNGIRLGFSGMSGHYDLEEAIGGENYRIFGTDMEFQYKDFSFSAEYVYGENDFRLPIADNAGNVNFNKNTAFLPSKMEINKGYYLQVAFPIGKQLPKSKPLLGILAYNKIERVGPELIWSQNANPSDGLPIATFSSANHILKTSMNKYTAGMNCKMTKNFIIKAEYSYWIMKIPSASLFGSNVNDISQSSFSAIFSF